MTTVNDITKPTTKAYRDNYGKIFKPELSVRDRSVARLLNRYANMVIFR